MARRSVVIVAFDGMQPLDAVGPHEVFAGATALLAAKKRANAGYDLSIVSEHGTPITTESGLQIVTAPFPAGRLRIDTLLIPGGEGSQTARVRRSAARLDSQGSTQQPACRNRVQWDVHRC